MVGWNSPIKSQISLLLFSICDIHIYIYNVNLVLFLFCLFLWCVARMKANVISLMFVQGGKARGQGSEQHPHGSPEEVKILRRPLEHQVNLN